jgi:hypothetical protein
MGLRVAEQSRPLRLPNGLPQLTRWLTLDTSTLAYSQSRIERNLEEPLRDRSRAGCAPETPSRGRDPRLGAGGPRTRIRPRRNAGPTGRGSPTSFVKRCRKFCRRESDRLFTRINAQGRMAILHWTRVSDHGPIVGTRTKGRCSADHSANRRAITKLLARRPPDALSPILIRTTSRARNSYDESKAW